MNEAIAPALRTLAFADLDAGSWGAAWFCEGDDSAFVLLSAGGAMLSPALTLAGASASEEWRLSGDGTELTLTRAGDAVTTQGPEDGLTSLAQLCRFSGQLVLDGVEREIDCLGQRGSRTQPFDSGRIESIREVSAWFEPADGFLLTAIRPRKARGHDADSVTAAVLEHEAAVAVADPRLSTTYSREGRPSRASLELWLSEDSEEQYPRRAAGEATGTGATTTTNDLGVQAELFRWHSRGRDGAGVYLLAYRR